MKLIEFYRGEIPNAAGRYIDEILRYNYGQLEADHQYIQWLFPLPEPSMFWPAPLLDQAQADLFVSDPSLRAKLRESMVLMLDFYGVDVVGESMEWQKPGVKHEDPIKWLKRFNHNMLRVTRLLRSMRLTGLEDRSQQFYALLMQHRAMLEKDTVDYWQDAVYG